MLRTEVLVIYVNENKQTSFYLPDKILARMYTQTIGTTIATRYGFSPVGVGRTLKYEEQM